MRCYLLFVGLLLGFVASAQKPNPGRGVTKGTIEGVLLDSVSGKPLREASVALMGGRDSSYLAATITGGDGQFALRNVAPGSYQLLLTFHGYESRRHAVRVTAEAPHVQVGTLRLVLLTQSLGEVVIQQERAPVSVSGDTLAFSARAFKTQPNAAVESLLKKLPGVEVDRAGNIRAQGQSVNRVLVDGKPFFGDDPKVATRNLPADIIDQVQLFDQQSDQAAFSGMDDGNRQRTMNLVTKRDKRKGYFGPNSVGVGTNGRYRGNVSLNRFNNGRQVSLLGMANNVNQQGFGDGGGLPGASGSGFGPGGLPGGGFLNGDSPLGGDGGAITIGGGSRGSDGPEQPDNIIESGAGGLNYRDAWGRRAEVATSYFTTRTTVTTDQQTRRESVVPAVGEAETPLSLITNQSSYSRPRTTGHRFNFRLDYTLDSLTSLRLTPSVAWQRALPNRTSAQQAARGAALLNVGQTRYDGTHTTWAGIGNALLMRKFKHDGRSASLNLASSVNDQAGTAFNRAANTFFTPTDTTFTAQNQRIGQDAGTRSHVLTLAYTEPLSLTRKLQVQAALTDSRASGDRTVRDFDGALGDYGARNAALSNAFTSSYTAQRLGLALQTRRLRYGWGLGLDAQQAQQRVDDRTTDTLLARRFTTLLPNAMLTWNGPRGRTLRLNYRTRFGPAAATQLQPVTDKTNPLQVRTGNPNLRPEYYHTLSATYQHFNMATSRSVFGLLTASQVQDRITSATTIDAAGVQTQRPVNADGYRQLTGFFSVGQRFAPAKLNVNLTTNAALSRTPSFVNGAPNTARSWQVGQGLNVNSTFDETLEFGIGANVTRQTARYSLLSAQNAAFWTQTLTADAFVRLPAHFNFTTDLWYTTNTGRAAGYNQRIALWNAGLAWQCLPNQQGELKLQVFDLLRQNRGIDRTVGDTYVEDIRSRVLTRYWLVGFSYQLRKFGV